MFFGRIIAHSLIPDVLLGNKDNNLLVKLNLAVGKLLAIPEIGRTSRCIQLFTQSGREDASPGAGMESMVRAPWPCHACQPRHTQASLPLLTPAMLGFPHYVRGAFIHSVLFLQPSSPQ